MLRERPGNLVVLSGRNRGKIDRIVASVRGGLHVLADKPWILKSEDLPKVEAALAEADAKGVVAYDIMTERFELTSILQRALVNDPATFGEMVKGTEADPAVYMESVHHLMKTVAGAPNIRPAWFFDTAEQGEGLNDIGTHLVDLVQWTLFPDKTIDYKSDVRVLAAQRWPTVIPEDQFRRVTGEPRFPGEPGGIDQGRQARVLRQHAGVVHAARHPHQAERHLGLGSAGRIRRHAFRVLQGHARAHRGPPDAGRSLPAGALCRARGAPRDKAQVLAAVQAKIAALQQHVSGHRRRRARRRHPRHHSGEAARGARSALRAGHRGLPEIPRASAARCRPGSARTCSAKYFVTTTGTELSRKSPARPAARIAPR